MGRCLAIPEFITGVCRHLDTMERVEEGRQRGSLAALAVVCRKVSPYALDVLWAHLSSVLPLLMCMPSDLWDENWMPSQHAVRQLVRYAFAYAFTAPIHASFPSKSLEHDDEN